MTDRELDILNRHRHSIRCRCGKIGTWDDFSRRSGGPRPRGFLKCPECGHSFARPRIVSMSHPQPSHLIQ